MNISDMNTMNYVSHRKHYVHVYGRKGDTISVTITITVDYNNDFTPLDFQFVHTIKSEFVKMLYVEYYVVTHFDTNGELLIPLHITVENFKMVGEMQ